MRLVGRRVVQAVGISLTLIVTMVGVVAPTLEDRSVASALTGDVPDYLARLVRGPTEADATRDCAFLARCDEGRLGVDHLGVNLDHVAVDATRVTGSVLVVTVALWWLIAVPLGVAAARRPILRGVLDTAAVAGRSVPGFTVAIALLYLGSSRIGLFPIGQYRAFDATDPGPWLRSLIGPALSLALPLSIATAAVLRTSLAEEAESDHARAARGRGVSESRLLWRYLLRPALPSAVAFASAEVALLVTGAMVVEWIYSLPGLGFAMVASTPIDGFRSGDIPTLVAAVVAASALVAAVTLVADGVIRAIDPRTRA